MNSCNIAVKYPEKRRSLTAEMLPCTVLEKDFRPGQGAVPLFVRFAAMGPKERAGVSFSPAWHKAGVLFQPIRPRSYHWLL